VRAAPFEYHSPSNLSEALRLLDELGAETIPLAGGQSLIPLLNHRRVRPRHVVDLNSLAELDYIREENDGWLAIGALTRYAQLERSAMVQHGAPLLPAAAKWVGDPQVRARGSIGGSMAFADPSAELPAAVLALDGKIVLASRDGQRVLAAADFFTGPWQTALVAGELVIEVRIPDGSGCSWGFGEIAHAGSAEVIAAAALCVDHAGACSFARLALAGVARTPVRARVAEQHLVGRQLTVNVLVQAADFAAETVELPYATSKAGIAAVVALDALRDATGPEGARYELQ